MELRNLIILLTFLLLISACKDTTLQEETDSEIDTVTEKTVNEPVVELPKVLYTWVDQLRLRKTPNSKGQVLIKLIEGDSLKYLGEETVEKYDVTLRGKKVNAPWIKVETFKGVTGWVFGGGTTTVSPLHDRSPMAFDKCYIKEGKRWTLNKTCSTRLAYKQLKSDSRFVKLRRGELVFTLLNGQLKALKNQEKLSYTYFGYLDKMGFFVVKVVEAEGGHYLLINDKTGQETIIQGVPKPSPNGKYLVTTNVDSAEGFEFNGIQVWGFSETGFEKQLERELEDEEAYYPQWLDNKTIRVSVQPKQNMSKGAADELLILYTAEGEWEYEDRNIEEL